MITPSVKPTVKIMASSSIHIYAPAKINLTLNVTGKRTDGYHFLHSLTCFSDFGDDIIVKPNNEFQFTIDSEIENLSIAEDNLVVKTARLLAKHFKKPLKLHIHLNKRIPMGAGLGGGSTDAAATAKALLQFWNITPNQIELDALLLSLGADVPVCYYAQPCIFEGIGEIIRPVNNAPDLHAVLVYPNEHSSTPEIFQNYDGKYSEPKNFQEENILNYIIKNDNDLTAPAIKTTPVIKNVLKEISKTQDCLGSRMSGSGSCCFGLYKSEELTQYAADKIQKERPNWWVRPVILKGSQ